MANIRYPTRFDKNMPWVVFTPYRFVAPIPASDTDDNRPQKNAATDVDTVTLYMPGGIQEGINAQWQPEQLLQGAGGNVWQQLAGNVAGGLKNNANVGGIVSSAQGFVGGGIPVPSDMLIFQHIDPMTINLNFKMIPYNKQEGENILKIVNVFKKQIQPSFERKNDFYLRFPVIWDIGFRKIKGIGITDNASGLRGFDLMALTSCNVAYNSGIESGAVYEDGTPVQIDLSLSFQHIKKHWIA